MQITLPFGAALPPNPEPEPEPEPEPAPEPARANEVARLTAELETALLREIRLAWDELNASFFRRKLHPPVFTLSDSEVRLGLWTPEVRSIELSRRLVIERPWGVVIEVLKHEMAHQWVHEVLKQSTESAHGPAFRDTCQKLGIDASATGLPEAAPDGHEARVLERVARLLALAGSPNVNEAQAAASAAQRLMLKYNLEQAATKRAKGYAFRHVGKPSGRVLEPERVLAAILAKHFFVDVIWVPIYLPLEGKRATVLEVCGTKENLAMAEYVHGFLAHTAVQLWEAGEAARRGGKRRDRTTFLAGVMLGFLEKLDAERTVQKSEGLVWVKDGDLVSYLRQRHPHIQTVRRGGARRNEAHQRGREAGRSIVLRKPVEGGPTARGRLLPPKK